MTERKGIKKDPLAAHFAGAATVEPPKREAESEPGVPAAPAAPRQSRKRKAPKRPSSQSHEIDLDSTKILTTIRVPEDLMRRARALTNFTPETLTSLVVLGLRDQVLAKESDFRDQFGRDVPDWPPKA